MNELSVFSQTMFNFSNGCEPIDDVDAGYTAFYKRGVEKAKEIIGHVG